MKNIIILLLTFVTLSAAQQNMWISPNPSPGQLNGIFFLDSLIGWAVGNNSSIIKTIDGGKSWSLQSSPKLANLTKVFFSDHNNGIIVGGDGAYSHGALLQTSDGGERWIDRNPYPQDGYSFHDVSFHSKKIGYINGFAGVEKTVDGGKTWENSLYIGSGWGTTVFFIDSLTGWAGNTIGYVYKTTNAGKDWSLISKLGFKWHKRIRFINPSVGWLIGKGLYSHFGYIYKTIDGGISWHLQDSLMNNRYYDLKILDSLNVWVVGENGRIKYTNDGGNKWSDSLTGNTNDYFGISIKNDKKWVVGGDYHYPVIFSSKDNFQNQWIQRNEILSFDHIKDIDFSDGLNGWLAGSNGALFKTVDGGDNWQSISAYSINFTALSSPSSQSVFIAGDQGELVRSFDGGSTWQVSSITNSLNSEKRIKFFSDRIGYYLDLYQGNLLKTINKGDNWDSLGEYFNGFYFSDSLNGWVYTYPLESNHTILYHTEDGGKSWSDTLALDNIVNSIFFKSKNIGWYSSDHTLYKSIDSGRTWMVVNQDIGFEIKKIIFINENEGYFLDGSGYSSEIVSLYYTNDGGISLYPIQNYTYLDDLHLFDSFNGFAVGNYGQILSFKNTVLSIENTKEKLIPKSFYLTQNFPNPFNPTTTIKYILPKTSFVQIEIFDINGRKISTIRNSIQQKGIHFAKFDGSNLSSGVYLYRLTTKEKTETKKMVLIQ